MVRRLSMAAVAAFFVVAVSGAAADSFGLTVVSQTNSTITFSYPPQAGYGYLYSANGQVVSRTNDPARAQVRFAKASVYEVAAIVKGATGSYPVAEPPPPPPPPAVACGDGADNDGDGKVDFPADPGCSSVSDTDETDAVLPPPSTITSAQCDSLASVPGAVIANVHVTGGCDAGAANVTFDHVTLDGTFGIGNGTHVTDSFAMGFDALGPDGWTIENSTFDGEGQDPQNLIWDAPAGVTPDNWVIRNNTFKNFYKDDGSHSEALYVGYSTNGLIEGNTFVNNGNTSHVFFTNFGNQFNGSSYPRNVCVRGNTFGATHGAFFDVNFHPNVSNVGPAVTGIRIDPDNVMPHGITNPEFVRDC